jgi:hypothetical protein
MAQTTIKVKTFMCPNGLGNPNASCRFHRAFDNLPIDKMCPTCRLALVKSTDPNDKITMTVMGVEDIEPEIEQAIKGERKDIDVSTEAKKVAYRAKRKQDIVEAIRVAKLSEDV